MKIRVKYQNYGINRAFKYEVALSGKFNLLSEHPYEKSPEMQVSTEAIYLWVYRHESRKILTQFLRKKRKYRRKRKVKGVVRGGIKNQVSIHQRSNSESVFFRGETRGLSEILLFS